MIITGLVLSLLAVGTKLQRLDDTVGKLQVSLEECEMKLIPEWVYHDYAEVDHGVTRR